MIDATFATRDLVFTLNRAPRYHVLVLTEKPARLFEATTNVLTEVTNKPFPMIHKGPGGASKLPGGQGINRSAVRDESHREFFRKVDDALAAVQKEDHLPVVVVGVERYLAFYQEITKDPDAIVGLVAGSHDNPNPTALGKLVWPVFKAGATLRRTRALVRLNEAVSLNRHASGIDQVWRAAYDNRCQTVLVETGFEYPADVDSQGDRLLPYSGRGAAVTRRRRGRSDRKGDRPRWRCVFLRARRPRSPPTDRRGIALLSHPLAPARASRLPRGCQGQACGQRSCGTYPRVSRASKTDPKLVFLYESRPA